MNTANMHRNYFLFERQISHLNNLLPSALVKKCFTHRVDELVIQLESAQTWFLRIGLQPSTPYLIIDPPKNIREPVYAVFEQFLPDKVEKFSIIPYDKLVMIVCKNHLIQCKFYGANPNIILTDPKGNRLASFKKMTDIEKTGTPQIDSFADKQTDLADVDRSEIDQPVSLYFIREIGGFNNTLTRELIFRANLDASSLVCDLPEKQWVNLFTCYRGLIQEFKNDRIWLYEHAQKKPVLSLTPLGSLPAGYSSKVYNEINQGWKQFLFLHYQKNVLQRSLQKSLSAVKRKIDYLQSSLKKISDFDQMEEKKKLSELKGHLLQTFASDIGKGTEQTVLKNIFSAEGEEILITLNPGLTVQENANRYFNKYKNIETIKSDLVTKRDTYNYELKYWQTIYKEAEQIDTLNKADKLASLLAGHKVTQTDAAAEKNLPADTFSFNRLLLDKKWEILIGKNARNNDLLTFKFAHKYDIWLHAQGVPGSHVIIHLKDKNSQPAIEIIEKAASIAAYFSQAKNSSTVPVNYTNVKYVRKPRKAPAGMVVITNEKTLFVEPRKYL